MKFIRKNKRSIILLIIGLLFILSGILSWKLFFSKYKQFNEQEKLLLDTAKRYYSFNQKYLPKSGETRELTYKFLAENNHIEDLYIPGTNKLCDIDNSWVRIYKNEKEEYIYTTYLKCGHFESKVDHNGPVITLKGDSNIILSLGSSYKEPGIEKVVDDKDGNIDIKNVVIDSSSVNTNKIGTYNVTYTIMDKSYNKTVITRKITVANNLTNIVRNKTDESNYYKGNDPNNYILFSGMLFRIINVNDDGSIKIIAYDNIANIPYGNYEKGDSNLNDWLNTYFYSKIHDTSYLKTNNKWCIDNFDNKSYCNTYSEDYTIGMLSAQDYYLAEYNGNYLNSVKAYWLTNKKNDNFAYMQYRSSSNNMKTENIKKLLGVRPVLVLKNNLYLLSGTGTIESPYRIGDYNFGNTGELLNNRIIGEYVNYFGMTFRISEIDNDKNIKLISADLVKNNTTGEILTANYQNTYKYNPNEEGNIGYKINNDYLDFLDEKYIITHEFSIPTFDVNKKYHEYNSEKIKAKIAIPTSYEIFSGSNTNVNISYNYWLLDFIDNNQSFIINNSNGIVFTVDNYNLYNSNGFKIVFYVSKDTTISSGNGTINSPYIIK